MVEHEVQWHYPERPLDVLCHYPNSFLMLVVQDSEKDSDASYIENLSLLSEKNTFQECSIPEIQSLIDLHDRYCLVFQKTDGDAYIESFLHGCLAAKLKIQLLQKANTEK